MSLVAAHQWLQLEQPPAAGPCAPPLDDNVTSAVLASAAGTAGYPCTESELQTAFQQDWIMRWLRYTQNQRPDTAP